MEKQIVFPVQEFGAKKVASLRSKGGAMWFNKGKKAAWYAFVIIGGKRYTAFSDGKTARPEFSWKTWQPGMPADLKGKGIEIRFLKAKTGKGYAQVETTGDDEVVTRTALFVPLPKPPAGAGVATKDLNRELADAEALVKALQERMVAENIPEKDMDDYPDDCE